ncbi:hypothetical protein KBC79_03600 [Candidatus Woesebacteria bacterium]|nr:hypothetical protein [Candidatus Woesebacteria bacterium]
MANQSYPIPKSNPNAHMSIMFFLVWIVNMLVIFLANQLFPNNIVLGTMSLSPFVALVLSTGVLAWATTVTMPIFTEIEIRKQMVLTPQHWLIGYLLLNFISLWVVARFADSLGLGISSWFVVLALAAVLDFVQGMTIMAYGQARKPSSQK